MLNLNVEEMEDILDLLEKCYPVLPDPSPTTEWSSVCVTFAKLRQAIEDAKTLAMLDPLVGLLTLRVENAAKDSWAEVEDVIATALYAMGYVGEVKNDETGNVTHFRLLEVADNLVGRLEAKIRKGWAGAVVDTDQPTPEAVQTLEELHEMALEEDALRDDVEDGGNRVPYCPTCGVKLECPDADLHSIEDIDALVAKGQIDREAALERTETERETPLGEQIDGGGEIDG